MAGTARAGWFYAGLGSHGTQNTTRHAGPAGKMNDGNALESQSPGSQHVESIVVAEVLDAGGGAKEDYWRQVGGRGEMPGDITCGSGYAPVAENALQRPDSLLIEPGGSSRYPGSLSGRFFHLLLEPCRSPMRQASAIQAYPG